MLRQLLPFVSYNITWEHRTCDLCGSEDFVVLSRWDRRWKPLTSVACTTCGLIRTEPMPSAQDLDSYYASGYRLDYQVAGRAPPPHHRVRSRKNAQLCAARFGSALRHGARVLDVGCGSGEFLALCKARGCETLGIDPGQAYVEYAREAYGVDARHVAWSELDAPDGAFDVINCFHVLEHLPNPTAAVQQFARWLTPDGRLLLAVPDMRPSAKPSFERFHFAHVHGFIPETLSAVAAKADLVVVDDDETTTRVFRRDGDAAARVPITDASRAKRLAEGYGNDSIAAYVFGGGWLTDTFRRNKRWLKDSVAPRT